MNSSANASGSDERVLSDQFTEHVTLKDVRLSQLNLQLHDAAPVQPVETQAAIDGTEFESDQRTAIYHLSYRFATRDKKGQAVWNIAFTLSVSFGLIGDYSPDDEAYRAFGKLGVVDIAHPYARELLHNVTLRMNVPAFVLEVQPWLTRSANHPA